VNSARDQPSTQGFLGRNRQNDFCLGKNPTDMSGVSPIHDGEHILSLRHWADRLIPGKAVAHAELEIPMLEEIAGIGAKRRTALLKHFGGINGVATAGIEELAQVRGVSRELAATIYAAFHG